MVSGLQDGKITHYIVISLQITNYSENCYFDTGTNYKLHLIKGPNYKLLISNYMKLNYIKPV